MGARPFTELSWGAQSRSHGPPEELWALADVVLSLHLLSPPWQGWEAASPRDGSLPFAILPTVLLAIGSQRQVRAGQQRAEAPRDEGGMRLLDWAPPESALLLRFAWHLDQADP